MSKKAYTAVGKAFLLSVALVATPALMLRIWVM